MSNLRFVEKLANAPWMCAPEHVEFLHSIFLRYVDRAATGQRLDVQAVEQSIGRPLDNTREVTIKGGVARIPVEGTIMRRASLFTQMSGGVSTEAIAKDFITAYNDATVHSILFVFDSPGGEAHGIGELAEIIREKRDLGEKRIEAYCDGMCASAAYFLASATSKITADARATVGSIGTVTRVRNPDAAGKTRDLEFWNARSPKKRVDPTTEAGREAIQSWIDDMGDEFIQAVADNRGVSFEKVVEDFGQGFVMTGRRAVAAGMVDEIGSEEGVMAALSEAERERRPVRIVAATAATATDMADDEREEQVTETTDVRPAEPRLEATEQPEETVGLFKRLGAALGLTVVEAAAQDAEPPGTHEDAGATAVGSDDASADQATDQREEKNDDMTETNDAAAATTDTREEDRPTALSNEERAELERLRAERAASEAETARLAATLRERGIERMLDARGNFDLGDGKRGALPKAQRDAATALIASLAAAGTDPIALSASGEATLKDNEAGRAIGSLLTDWKPQELGERGTREGEARKEGAEGDHERVLAELEEQGLGKEHYAAVAGELAAKGEIRREA
ncbi:MAG: S49 family peptidase [Actinomycetota bacterium]|nr:S49 family peptidase [Actinomycetota bacterium]